MMYETARSILNMICEAGYEAYIVGGYPRDRYLGLETTDFDLCTNAPQALLERLFNVKKTTFASSIIDVNGQAFQITLFRRDGTYKHHRFPEKITLVDDLKTDLQRRDFVINTLCINAAGEEVDLLGARSDLDQRIIRAVGNADQKMEEDALRILRAIRFATVLDFTLDSELQKAMMKHRHLVSQLSKHRQQLEIAKIRGSRHANRGKQLLQQFHLEWLWTED